jgi:3-oxoadipate enol-lactonase
MELWHQTAGTGPPIAFLHAGLCDSRMWEPQWDEFAATHRVVRCDLRGFGRSPIPPLRYSDASDVVELLGNLGLGPVSVVGASLGGRVALELAVARPDLVADLVLAPAVVPDHNWSKPVLELGEDEDEAIEAGDLDAAVETNLRLWLDAPDGRGDADPEVRRFVGQMQRHAFELQMPVWDVAEEDLLVPDLGGRLADVKAPTLVITGEDDLPDIQQIAATLDAEIPRATRETIPKATHLPNLQRPDEFNRIVRAFLERQ